MPLDESSAVSNYQDGINRASGNPWRDAADANSISEAASTMEQAFNKGGSVTTDQMVSNWRDKY